jgi:hypothetical protein
VSNEIADSDEGDLLARCAADRIDPSPSSTSKRMMNDITVN